MADWGDFLNKSSGFGGGSITRNEDFDEEDVWDGAIVSKEKEKDYSSPKTRVISKKDSGSSSAWHQPTPPTKIPRANNNTLPSYSSSSSCDAHVVNLQGSNSSSAPMDIPDWSKIYGKKGSMDGDSSYGDHHYHDDHYGGDDDDDDENGMIPPHEWIARRLARSQISSFSVCEGVGRTLKGRDLSKVRNAILTKTGFIE